ncbi:transketolase, partial [mine drainage metagenome]
RSIVTALGEARRTRDRPTAILALTVPGRGVPAFEATAEAADTGPTDTGPTDAELDRALAEMAAPPSGRPPVTPSGAPEDLRDACAAALVDLGGRDPLVTVVEADRAARAWADGFGARFPARRFDLGPNVATATAMAAAAGLALSGRVVFAGARAAYAAGGSYLAVRDAIAAPGADVKIVGVPAGLRADGRDPDEPVDDVGI